MRGRDGVDAGCGACDDDLVGGQRDGATRRIEDKELEGVFARLGERNIENGAGLQRVTPRGPAGVEAVDLQLGARQRFASELDGDTGLEVWGPGDVVERKIEIAPDANRTPRLLATAALRRPIDRFCEDGRAFGPGRHRLHIGRRGDAELEGDLVAQWLILGGATHEDHAADVARIYSSFLHGLACRFYRLVELVGHEIVEPSPGQRDVEVDVLSLSIAERKFALVHRDDRLVLLREIDLGHLGRPLGKADKPLVDGIGDQVLGKVETGQQPGDDDAVADHAVEVAPAAHLDAAMAKEIDAASGALGDRDVERPAAEVIDQENAVRLSLPHDAHDRSDRLLHERDLADPGELGGREGGILLHLVEGGRNRNHRTRVRVVPYLLRQISVKHAQDLGRALLRRERHVQRGYVHGRACPHVPLEQRRRVVRAAGRLVIGALADIFASAAAVEENGRWRDLLLLRAQINLNVLPIEGAYGAVRRAEVDADIGCHLGTF